MWSIENQCPQCGSPVVIEETDRIFSCRFCRVRLFICGDDLLRYYLPAQSSENLIYVPYWRLKGISFSVMPYEVAHDIVDSSLIACKTLKLPFTMGLRPQTMKLRFVSPDLKGEFIKPRLTSKEASTMIDRNLKAAEQAAEDAMPMAFTNKADTPRLLTIKISRYVSGASASQTEAATPFFRTFVGGSASLIYMPFYIRDKGLFDAILDRRVAGEEDVEKLLADNGQARWQARFLSTLCPECGADLAGDKKSTTLFCNGCFSAWEAGSNGLSRVEFGIMPGGKDPAYLPFWRIKASVEGMELKSFGDLARAANLPRVMKAEWDEQALYFWQPAFKVNPPLYLRLGREVTMKQPQNGLETRLEVQKAYPVTLSAAEAAESIKISLAGMVSMKKFVFPILKDIEIKMTEALLVYVPFEQKSTELVQQDLGMTVMKNTLDVAGNL